MTKKYSLIISLLLALVLVQGFFLMKGFAKPEEGDLAKFQQESTRSPEKISQSETGQSEQTSQEMEVSTTMTEASSTETSQESTDWSRQEPPKLASQHAHEVKKLAVTPQVQRAWNTCAPTTVSMLLSYKGVTVSQEQLALEMKTDDSFGTHNANAIAVLNKHLFGYENPQANQAGYRLATVTSVEGDIELFKQRVKQNIDDGYPMYYTFDIARMYPGAEGEHNVIGIGYQLDETGQDIEKLYYLDPGYGIQDPVYGGLKVTTPEELLYAMLTCVEPNYGW